jgi:hypothetical protein
VLVLTSGCGGEETEEVNATEATLSPGERKDLLELAVSAEQLPPLGRTTEWLIDDDVVAQASVPDLRQVLDAAEFRGGVKVEYRGDSPRLTGVESQVLTFSSEEGAADFSDYLAQHAGSFFGEPIEVEPMAVGGRDGWRIDPPVCDCAGAQPLSAGAVHAGPNVIVLQITGPKASPNAVKELLTASVSASR